MKKSTAFAVYYNKINRSSFNVLVGAIETEEYLKDINIYFIKKSIDIIPCLEEILLNNEKIIFGISFFTIQIWEIEEIIKKVKEKFGNRIICIAGGPHPTGDPYGTLKMGFDAVFIGEGEESIIEFFTCIKKNEDYKNIKGIAYLQDNNLVYTGKRIIADLNKFPPFAPEHYKFGHIEITRGCPFACSYCQVSYIFGANIRHRSIENIIKYANIMLSRNLKDFRVITPNALSYGSSDGRIVNLKALEELLSSIKKLYKPDGKVVIGYFPSEVRPEHITEETMELLKEYADNREIIMGAQSGSERILKKCKRGHSIEDVYNGVRLCLKYGFIPNVDFIFGLPGETEEDIKMTLNMIKDLVKLGAKIHAHTFTPLPATPFCKQPPGTVQSKIRNELSMILKKSKEAIYGNWTKQEREAKKIFEHLNNIKSL